MSDATDNRFYREKQEQPSSKELCHAHEIKEVPRYGIPGTIWDKQHCPYCKIEELKQKLTAAEQLAVRQGNEIRRLRGPVKGEPA